MIYIFLGGGAGSIARYLVGKFSLHYLYNGFPLGTLLANILASFILGFISVKSFSGGIVNRETLWMPLLATGFCGGFSTFSTFSLESFNYLQTGQYGTAFVHTALNMLLCLVAVSLGFWLGK
jgi:CrcB protein